MPRYRERPPEIEAFQYQGLQEYRSGDPARSKVILPPGARWNVDTKYNEVFHTPIIDTVDGIVALKHGDFVAIESDGVHVYSAADFSVKYEPIVFPGTIVKNG